MPVDLLPIAMDVARAEITQLKARIAQLEAELAEARTVPGAYRFIAYEVSEGGTVADFRAVMEGRDA